MKIFKKIKSLILPKQKVKKKPISMCDLIIERIDDKKKDSKGFPEELTKKEWVAVLNEISFAFKVKKTNSLLKSPARINQRKNKLKKSFQLFEKYLHKL
mgnify:CR=1 FL=1